MNISTTTLLGREYTGRPMFGSLAMSIHLLEREGKHEDAQKLLDAHNHIRRCFGKPEYDLANDMTVVPLEGVITVPAGRVK